MQPQSSVSQTFNFALKGVAVAMAVAVIVLQVLGAAAASTLVTLLGVGLFALALETLRSK
jgi:hypothetical protein